MNKRQLPIAVKVIPAYSLVIAAIFVAYFTGKTKADNISNTFSDINTINIQTSVKAFSEIPVGIYIPDLKIFIPVINGSYDLKSNTWNVEDGVAHYALETSKLNTVSGNTLIYGHDSRNVFGNLHKLKNGSEVWIHTENGLNLKYELTLIETVSPYDVSLFEYSGEPRLTLLTCTGSFDSKRLILHFKLKN